MFKKALHINFFFPEDDAEIININMCGGSVQWGQDGSLPGCKSEYNFHLLSLINKNIFAIYLKIQLRRHKLII